VIPEDWEVTTVGEEFSIQLGKMLDAEKNVGVLKPYLGNRAVQWGRVDLTGIGFMKMSPSDLQRFRLRQGDLLVCEGGEIGRAAIWKEPIVECYYQKALHRLRPKGDYDVELMLNVLQRLSSTGFLLNFVTQTSIAHLPQDKFETVPIPLPSTKAEQVAIAEALSDADALIESLEQLLAKKRQLKQAAMQELLTGKRRLPGFSGEWEVRPFDEVLSRSNVKAHQIQTSDYQTTGQYPVVNQGREPIIAFSDRRDKRFRCPAGGGIVFGDHTCIVKFVDFDFLVGADGTQILEARDGQSARFHALQLQLNGIVPTGYNRHFKFLKERGFLAPSLAEQEAIATILSDMDAEIAALEAKLAKARQLKQGMMQELLTGRIRLV
jgi:type I restriction enzyme S subunit